MPREFFKIYDITFNGGQLRAPVPSKAIPAGVGYAVWSGARSEGWARKVADGGVL